ncbi:uncharacterized protein LOC111716278 [Eurytemora carolleeae]|uniref:uncharacterized protein LOC111716278 n=1 Tax=Eurytemora carolleeae TaxID=1294199 RepID=UPI000C7601A7|nr:uncharacterized protein LOC111716278 [Eurytemora carolleeae]|eukprot:XP_023347484.1 uncharacterized protein LOC111716278 [Eurytemora affinis]
MIKYRLILLGVLLLKLGSVFTDCTEQEDQNRRNTIQWFIRKAQDSFTCLDVYLGIDNLINSGNQQLLINNETDNYKVPLDSSKCLIIISNKLTEVDAVLKLGYSPSLVIILQQDVSNHLNHLDLRRLTIFSKCLSTFTYWDLHKQKFSGVWSTYYSTVVFDKSQDLTHQDSFYNQKIRVGYNEIPVFFSLINDNSDSQTQEGLWLRTFTDKYKLQPLFINANYSMGGKDPDTGDWLGIIGMVRYDEVDLAVGSLGTDPEINEFLSPSPQLGESYASWVTRYPGQVSPAYNILKVFDKYTWTGILVSMIFATAVLLFLSNLIKSLGFEQPDNVLIALLPLSLLNAEGMPDWFLFNNKRLLSGSLLVLIWALASTLLTFAFSCNLMAIVLSPATGVPLDTSSEIVERKMVS